MIHRINTDIDIEELDNLTESACKYVLPQGETVVNKRGISFFYFNDVSNDDQKSFHNSFSAFKWRKPPCYLTSAEDITQVDGLGYVRDREITRRIRKGKTIAAGHLTLYPTKKMSFEDFKMKYHSILICHCSYDEEESVACEGKDGRGDDGGGKDDRGDDGGGKDDRGDNIGDKDGRGDDGGGKDVATDRDITSTSRSSIDQFALGCVSAPEPTASNISEYNDDGGEETSCTNDSFPVVGITSDWLYDEVMTDCPMKDECARVLFEYARNPRHPPDQCIRSLYFHYLLSEEGVTYSGDVLKGDALSFYIARAFDCCADARYEDAEIRRDDIRLALEGVLAGYNPRLRSYPDTEGEDTCANFFLFGDNTSNHSSKPEIYVTRMSSVIQKCKTSSQIDPVALQLLESLEGDTPVMCQAASLTAELNIPLDYARALCQRLSSNKTGAVMFAHAILETGGHSTALVTSVLRVVYTSPVPLPISISGHQDPQSVICVTLYQTPTMSRQKNLGVCKALHSCLTSLRESVWKLSGRLMVLCVSKDHYINMSKLVPSDGTGDDSTRVSLMLKKLRQVRVLKVDSKDDNDDDATVSACTNDVNIIFLACFDREVHLNAMENINPAFEALDVPNKEIFRIMV